MRPPLRPVLAVLTALMFAAPAEAGERRLRVDEVAASAAFDEAIEATNLEAIDRLKAIVAKAEGPQKAELLLRLGELYVEQARLLRSREVAQLIKDKDACFDRPGCVVDAIVEDTYFAGSRGWFEKSAKVYQAILAGYPQFERADEASYYLAASLTELGRRDDANTELTRFVRTWPQSRLLPDGYLLIGEYQFDKGEAFRAMNAYQRAAAFKDWDKWAFASYKLAWCYYNVGSMEDAVGTMRAVVRATGTQAVLQDEALRDLVRFYADIGDLERARGELATLGHPELMRPLLERLATLYVEQGKNEQALLVWRRLVAEAPDAPEAPTWADNAVDRLLAMDRKSDALDAVASYRRTYGKEGAWARANVAKPESLTAARGTLEKRLQGMANAWHNEARKLKTGPQAAKVYGYAEQAYLAWLEEYPDGARATEMRYGYAELAYAIKKYDAAYDAYMAVVAADPKGSQARFCAESAVFAAREMVRREAAPPTTGKAAAPLTGWEQKQLAALDQYTRLFNDEKTRGAIYESGYLLYNRNHLAEAGERFNRVIAMDPRSREAEQAANLILDGLALQEEWVALRDNARFYRDQANLGSASFKEEVGGVYERASLKVVEVGAANADKGQVAEAYLGFWKEFPKSAQADLALHNAAVYFRDAGRLDDAISARKSLVEGFRTSRFWADDVAALAFDYESTARFREAATWYERLANDVPTHASAADALYSAALFREALGEWEIAVRDHTALGTRWPAKAVSSTLESARILELHEKGAEAATLYAALIAKPRDATLDQQLHARTRLGFLTAKPESYWAETLAWYQNAGPMSEDGREHVAEIRFAMAQDDDAAYRAMKVNGPGKKMSPRQADALLQNQLTAKVREVKRLEGLYTAVIETGSGRWGLAALTRVGAAYEELAASIRGSWIPDYLTEDQREMYMLRLEDLAYVQEERAAGAYELALAKSRELQLYDANTAEAGRRLATLRPADHPEAFEKLQEPTFVSPDTAQGEAAE